ncbi:MAG: 30S ribosomal protein S12 methylthiotransferase RimO [Lachnospiraceae bacterium]|nr:30S ribosomal protein S12 methylthiotransferase RimO [Lachnospiraceae bacterium]
MNIFFVSLGCDKNLVDSEYMIGSLMGPYNICDDENEADIIVVNTCCFIHDAKTESIETIIEMGNLKKNGRLKYLIVTGCLAERYKDDIIKEIPEVDAVIGVTATEEIKNVIDKLVKDNSEHLGVYKELSYLPENKGKRVTSTGAVTAYLKIAEGCNKNCTYCIIPKIRGKYRSYPMEKLLEEAEELAKNGIKELIVIAQETTVYGMDLYGRKMLAELLKKLCEIDGISWIRLMYAYPEEITDELIQVMKEEDKICKYIDMPIQHASDRILKKMGRRTKKDDLVSIIEKLRKNIPDIVIRTTLITGFPSESDEDYEELVDFVYNMNFERLGVFTYSPEEDTAAALMDNQIDKEIKEARKDGIMELQQDIVFDKNSEYIGRTFDVIIEGFVPEEKIYVGRTYMDAPNIDGYIFVNSEYMLMSGDIIQAEVTAADGYDLIAEDIRN